jgi:hypothetical protein
LKSQFRAKEGETMHGRIKTICLLVALLLPYVATSSEADELLWPLDTKLKAKDWVVDTPQAWSDVGDVSLWNTRDHLKIQISPYAGLKLEEVSIHIVQDPADFDAILGKDGQPKVSKFDYKTNYLADQGILADLHSELVPLSNFEICWGVNPEKCPPNLYIIVHAELRQPELIEVSEGVFEEIWVAVSEAAYAENGGVFDRLDKDEGVIWGWYVTYPLAKAEPGHFIDANVNGLTYVTPTQSGVTGDAGQFWFLPGERVALSVGSLSLGDVLGDRRVSPVDLFEQADLEDDRVLNVARLLQSLDADGNPAQGAININESVIACLETALSGLPGIPSPEEFFADDAAVGALIYATVDACAAEVDLTVVTKEEALENLNSGMKAGNLMKRNVSKTPGMKSDKAKIEIMPVYVPAQRSDGSRADVLYHDADGNVIETRDEAKPIVVTYLDEIEETGAMDVFVAISRDDGETWKRRNVSKTSDKSSLVLYPGESQKPMLKVKDNKIFVAWTDKYCRGGRPGYAITVCPDTNGDGLPDPCEVCRETSEGTVCTPDYPGDDAYWQDDLFGVGGPQRSVIYEEYPEMGEVPYSCVWAARGVIDPDTGDIQWFKPERLTSGRRDAFQLFAGAGTDVGFAIVWQEDPKGLVPGEGDGPGDGWGGARTNNKTDIWYSYITLSDFDKIDYAYPAGGHGDNDDVVDTDPELAGRVKALVPMSLPVKVSDNDMCSLENMEPSGGHGEHDFDEEGEGTHRYCGTPENVGTMEVPGSNPLCAYTFEKTNPNGELHHVCVTADGRLLDGNTGASRPNIFLQPYKKPDGSKSAWAIVGYEERKGVGTRPDGEEYEDPCDPDGGGSSEEPDEDRYKPDTGKNVIYHSFDFRNPEVAAGGGIVNLPETDTAGNPVYLVDEFGDLLLDWKGEPQLAYENARRVRFVTQPKSKKGPSGTVLVAIYRQGEEGSGKPADIFMRRVKASATGNPYAFANFVPGAQNLSSVESTVEFQDPFDPEKPVKMLRWAWTEDNLSDSSAKNPYTDARAHRGSLNGDELIIGYSWTPNWGRRANDKYDFYIRRSFSGGQSWTTDPDDPEPIEHNVVFRVPVIDYDEQTVIWDEEVVSAVYSPGEAEPARNVSNLRNRRTSVLEPRLVKTPGTIKDLYGNPTGYPEDKQDSSVYQLAYGLEFNQNQLPDDVVYPKLPLDIYYSRTKDKGQRYESVIVTPQGGNGKPQEGWNPLAKDKPEQGAAQLRQTPDGSRMYGIWLEEGEQGSDIMFRRVDYR